ncbi:hypothetical protein TD95_004580 [Thielaviopsis punctulata]|uniref:3-oxo-5-alpha-steroid 4-dehydrogenase C-terminal domain-containing protein n=1 Tax=Thielaviopsis punctulata TaxID=72032 RepID=A0A0F4ZJW8_9PEZI|nr:hypothetical protein TD95_004580 [Thielaviopsis punctulata]
MYISNELWLTVTRGFASVFPTMGLCQFVTPWYGMGKTSTPSRFNLPGRWAWMSMEVPGFLCLLWTMAEVGRKGNMAWQSQALAGLFTIHYIYRAILFPLLQPSMAPIHPLIWLSAVCFQVCNGISLGGWLGGYGDAHFTGVWAHVRFGAGVCVFFAGLAGNYVHDEELRQLRRTATNTQEPGKTATEHGMKASVAGQGQDRYKLPQARLFRYILYPHYLCEWIEWLGFWMAAGWTCGPARAFVVNEVAAMLPRAIRGRQWYVEKFGAERVGKRWAVIPGLV